MLTRDGHQEMSSLGSMIPIEKPEEILHMRRPATARGHLPGLVAYIWGMAEASAQGGGGGGGGQTGQGRSRDATSLICSRTQLS